MSIKPNWLHIPHKQWPAESWKSLSRIVGASKVNKDVKDLLYSVMQQQAQFDTKYEEQNYLEIERAFDRALNGLSVGPYLVVDYTDPKAFDTLADALASAQSPNSNPLIIVKLDGSLSQQTLTVPIGATITVLFDTSMASGVLNVTGGGNDASIVFIGGIIGPGSGSSTAFDSGFSGTIGFLNCPFVGMGAGGIASSPNSNIVAFGSHFVTEGGDGVDGFFAPGGTANCQLVGCTIDALSCGSFNIGVCSIIDCDIVIADVFTTSFTSTMSSSTNIVRFIGNKITWVTGTGVVWTIAYDNSTGSDQAFIFSNNSIDGSTHGWGIAFTNLNNGSLVQINDNTGVNVSAATLSFTTTGTSTVMLADNDFAHCTVTQSGHADTKVLISGQYQKITTAANHVVMTVVVDLQNVGSSTGLVINGDYGLILGSFNNGGSASTGISFVGNHNIAIMGGVDAVTTPSTASGTGNTLNSFTDATAMHNGDAAGGDLGGTYPNPEIGFQIGKASVRLATAAALATNTYTAGVITASGNGALTVDGVAVAVGDRVAVANEASTLKNGVYDVTAKGDSTHPFVLTRSSDTKRADQILGTVVLIREGTASGGAIAYISGSGPWTIGTTAINWASAKTLPTGVASGDLTGTYPGPTLDLATRANATDLIHRSVVSGDTNARWSIAANGVALWGPGNAVQDTNLYRGGSALLKTDSAFQVNGGSTIYSGTGVPGSGVGTNGDVFLRTDGTAVTAIYVKVSSAWTAFTGTPGVNGTGLLAFFGDGSDGAQTFDGTTTILGFVPSSNVYTLTRDIYLSGSSALTGSAVIKTNGWRIYCTGTLTIGASAKITNNGTDASVGTPGAGGPPNSLGGGNAGGAGGSFGATGAKGTAQSNALGGTGGAGGSASAGGTGTGTIGGIATAPQPAAGGFPRNAWQGFSMQTNASGNALYNGGVGGTAGSSAGSPAATGSGGGAGGVVLIAAVVFVNNGAVEAKGGVGSAASGASGNAGGGGGGGGGSVVIITSTGATIGTVTVTGGAGAAGRGTGGAGGAGVTGNNFTLLC